MATVINLAFFYEKIRIRDYSFYLDENTIKSETQNGQVLTASLGNRRWRGSITLAPNDIKEQRRLNALVAQIQNADTFFEVTDYWGRFPYSDPKGTILGSNTVTASGATAGSFTLNLTGLPAGYALTAGDRLSYTLGGVWHLHEIVSDVSASGTGTATVTLLNPLRAGIPAAPTITLKKPRCTAKFVPGSMKSSSFEPGVASGVSFDWVQTLVVK